MLTHLSVPLVQNTRNLYFLSSHFVCCFLQKHQWKKTTTQECYNDSTRYVCVTGIHPKLKMNVIFNTNVFLSVSCLREM